jgi:hypothetical protein
MVLVGGIWEDSTTIAGVDAVSGAGVRRESRIAVCVGDVVGEASGSGNNSSAEVRGVPQAERVNTKHVRTKRRRLIEKPLTLGGRFSLL